MADPNDPRWGDYVPWFLRYQNLPKSGRLDIFFGRLSQRMRRLFYYNEANLDSPHHFGSQLESESLQRFREVVREDLHTTISRYFEPPNHGTGHCGSQI